MKMSQEEMERLKISRRNTLLCTYDRHLKDRKDPTLAYGETCAVHVLLISVLDDQYGEDDQQKVLDLYELLRPYPQYEDGVIKGIFFSDNPCAQATSEDQDLYLLTYESPSKSFIEHTIYKTLDQAFAAADGYLKLDTGGFSSLEQLKAILRERPRVTTAGQRFWNAWTVTIYECAYTE